MTRKTAAAGPTALRELAAALDTALAWLTVHPGAAPKASAALTGLRAIVDAGRAPSAAERRAAALVQHADALDPVDEELGDLLRAVDAKVTATPGAATGAKRARGKPKLPVFALVGVRPVRSVPLPDGGLDVLAFDWATGALVRDMSQLDILAPSDRDVDLVDVRAFYAAVDRARTERKLPRPARPTPPVAAGTPIDWLATGDAELPFRACVEGDEWQVRVDEWPDDPHVYTLIVNGTEAFGFDDWPDGWTRP